jgi:hypothetical protein
MRLLKLERGNKINHQHLSQFAEKHVLLRNSCVSSNNNSSKKCDNFRQIESIFRSIRREKLITIQMFFLIFCRSSIDLNYSVTFKMFTAFRLILKSLSRVITVSMRIYSPNKKMASLYAILSLLKGWYQPLSYKQLKHLFTQPILL